MAACCTARCPAPNYLGEIVEWTGWALATWSLAGLAFAVYTAANLAPRAVANHDWYLSTFDDYPRVPEGAPAVLGVSVFVGAPSFVARLLINIRFVQPRRYKRRSRLSIKCRIVSTSRSRLCKSSRVIG